MTSAHFESNLLWLNVGFQSSRKDIDVEGRDRIECEILPTSVRGKYSLIGYVNKEDGSSNFSTELHMMKDMQSASNDDANEIKSILGVASVIDCNIIAMNYLGPPIKLGHFSMDIKSISKQ